MRLPWQKKPEIRESSFTDTLIQTIVTTASGNVTANANATGAVETAAGVIARAFASAEVIGPEMYTKPLTPGIMALIGRALIRSGEVCLAIDVDDGMVRLHPVADFDITGGYMPEDWEYRLNLAGPSRYHTRAAVTSAAVCHFRYLTDPERPWHGIGPVESAALAGKLSAETLKALGDLSSGPRGSVMPAPKDGNDPTLSGLKSDLRKLNGNMSLVESMSAGWEKGQGRAGTDDWEQRHIQPKPESSLVELNKQATREILSCCGLSPALFGESDASGAREAFRQALHGCVQPLGKMVTEELREKLHGDILLNFDGLNAGDITSKARGFGSLVQGGMEVERAASLSGLLATDEAA